MKKHLFLAVAALLTTLSTQAADDDIFTANTVEGVEMTFKVLSEEAKTCEVGTGSLHSPSISTSEEGEITIPEAANGYTVTSIGESAFQGCTGLTSITIPEGVTRIYNLAFYGCTGLTSVTIPEGVTRIGELAFYFCRGLTKITSKIAEPFAIGGYYSNCFSSTTTDKATLYVPKGTVEKYKATDGWKEFKTILEIDDTGDVNSDGKVDITDVTLTISHILGQKPEGFSTEAADVNDDGKVDVTDVTTIIDIVLSGK